MRDEHIVDRLHTIAREDWERSHRMDLTDEGILADLEKHERDGAEDLAIDVERAKRKHAQRTWESIE